MLRPTRRLWTDCDVSPLPPAGGVGGGPVAAIPTPLQLGPAAQTQVSLPSRKREGFERNEMRYLPLTQADRSEMLAKIGAASIDDLFVDVPEAARISGPIEGLPLHASEMAVERHMAKLAGKNMAAGSAPFFLGAGAYRHHIPASVDHLIQRGEFLTAYTPYQPEIAQGTLQMLFEFQTQVARLYGRSEEHTSELQSLMRNSYAVFCLKKKN